MSSTHDGLLAAVIAEPDSDLPRLVMADWYDENGEPERAEFIRLQVELARLRRGIPRRRQLEVRTKSLLAEHGERWRRPFAEFEFAEIHSVRFRRGFVHSVSCGDGENAFGDYAAELFALAPIRRLEFWVENGSGESDSTHWFAQAGLQRLRELRCTSYESGTAARLLDSPHLRGLVRLELRGDDDVGHLSPEELRRLGGCPNLPALRALDLSGNWSGWYFNAHTAPRWPAEFLAGPLASQLTHVSLRHTMLSDEGAEIVAASERLRGLRRLDLSDNSLSADGMLVIARSPHLASLRQLDLSYNEPEGGGAVALPAPVVAELRGRFGDRVALGRGLAPHDD